MTKPMVSLLGIILCQLTMARSGWELPYLSSAGAGVSSSSFERSFGENPSFLAKNLRNKVYGSADSLGGSGQTGYGTHVIGGSGSWGWGLGSVLNQESTGFAGDTEFHGGFAVEFPGSAAALGVGVNYNLPDLGEASTSVDLGLLLNPSGSFHLGLVSYGINSSFDSLGVGLAVLASPYFTMLVDALYGVSASSLTLLPGIKLAWEVIQLSATYTIRDTGSLTDNLDIGLGLSLGKTFHIQSYYQRYGKYSLVGMLRF